MCTSLAACTSPLTFSVVASVVVPDTFNVSFNIADPEATIFEADKTPAKVDDPLNNKLPFI